MSVHIIVCIKSVVKAAPQGVGKRTPDNSELNPFDRPALEAALEIREQPWWFDNGADDGAAGKHGGVGRGSGHGYG